MDVVINAVQSVLSIVIMIGLGYYLTRRGWFNEDTSNSFSRLVVNISLPALMISNLVTTFDRDKFINAGAGIIIPFASMLLCYAAGMITAKLIRVKQGRRGIFQAMFFASNTIFMGMPVNIALFGEKSIPYVLFYYAANTTLFWTIGMYGVSKDSSTGKENPLSLNTVKRVFSPPLLGFLAGMTLIFLKVQLPTFILDSCKYLGNLTTPLSLLFIGMTFRNIDLKKIRFDKDMAAMLFGRFILAPLVVYGLALIIPIPALMIKVFVIQSAMPVIAQAAITAKAYDADHEYATLMVTVTTIISVIFIPIYMVLLNGLQ